MPDVTVHPHGTRWAVVPAGASSAVSEFETREAAEVAARSLADGGAVEVLDEDPTGLREQGGPRTGEEGRGPGEPLDGLTDHERVRTEQGGL